MTMMQAAAVPALPSLRRARALERGRPAAAVS
jgi:hypothetical protein